MFKSTDDGVNWEPITIGSRFKNPSVIYRHPNSTNTFVIQSDCEGVYVSSDNGSNWVRISKNTGCTGGEFTSTFSSTGDIYFPDQNIGILKHPFPEDGIWSSEKSEVIFDKLYSEGDGNLSVGVSTSNNIFITYRNPDDGISKYAKSESGELNSFIEITAPTNEYGGAVWKKSFNGSLYLISRGDRTFWELSDENNVIWTEKTYPGTGININGNFRFIKWKNDSELFVTGGSNGILYSNDNAQTWQVRNGQSPNALEFATNYDIEILGNSNVVIKEAGGDAYGLWVSTDQVASFNWISQDFAIGNCCNKSANDLLKLQDNSLLLPTSEGIQRSTDGINWTIQNIERYGVYTTSGTNEIYSIRKSNPIELVLSTDLGVSWTGTEISGGFPSDFHETYLFSYNNFLFVGIGNRETNQDELWRIDKNTAVATKLLIPNPTNSNGFELNGKIYISDGKTVSISTNQGNNWTSFEYPHLYMVPIDQKTGGIGLSSNGVLAVTQDDGQTFKNIGIDNPNAVITDLTRNISGVFFASTLRGSALKFDGDLILDVTDLPPSINFSWQQMNEPTGGYVNQLLVSPSNQLYATNSEALFIQNNAAGKWERINIPNHYYGYNDLTIDNSNNIFMLDSYQLLTSSDNGSSWNTNDNIGLGDARKIRKANNGNIVIATDSNILYGADLNSSLSVASGITTANFNQLELAGNGTLWASTNNNETSSLFKSNDDGVNWNEVNTLDLTGQLIYTINKLQSGAIAIVTNQEIFKSIDDGSSWTSIKSNISETSTNTYWPQLSKIYVDPNSNLYFYNQADLYFSEDEGVNWEILNSNYSGRDLINTIIWYNDQMLIGTTDAGILTSSDGGIAFNTFQNNNGFYGRGLGAILINNGDKFISHGYGEIIRTTDDGNNFTKIEQKIYSDILVKSYNGKLISYGGGISVSEDGGENFEDLNANLSGWVIGFSRAESENEKYYAITDEGGVKKFWVSENLIQWTEFSIDGLPANSNIDDFEVDPSGNIYLNIVNNSDYSSSAYLASFGNANLISQIDNLRNIHKYNGRIYLKSEGKVFITTDENDFIEKSTPNGDQFFITKNGYFFVTNENPGDAWISINGGDSWQKIPGFVGDQFNDIEIDLLNGYAYAVAQNQPLLKSTNIIIPNDNTAPVLGSFSPENNETGVIFDFNLILNFDEIVNPAVGKRIRLFKKNNPNTAAEIFNVEDGTFSDDRKTVSFEPSIEMEFLTEYFIIIDNGAFLDIFGNAYNGINNQTTWTFTTLEQPNLISVISSFSPDNNETAVALDFNLVLNFNAVVTADTGKKIRLFKKDNPNTAVEIFNVEDGSLSNNNNTISFEPGIEIEFLTEYYINIDNGAFLDVFGHPYSGINNQTTWAFTTLEEPDLESPLISFTSPTINKGQANTFSVNVVDNKSINLNGTNIYRRPISSAENANFSSNRMTAESTSSTTAVTFNISVSESWLDAMGLEYYFEAEDEAGNTTRLPNSTSEYFYSYINFANEKPDIKGIPFGSTEADYKMISVPHRFVDSQIATQFDELGAFDPNNYRIMTYKNEDEYSEYPDDLTNLGRGIGYWILLRSYKDVFLENASSPANNRDELFVLNLKAGWNQIGNPYTTPISWEEVRAENLNVIGPIKRYSNGNYSNGDVLQAYEAGFVYAENNISLPIYFQGGNPNARVLEKVNSSNLITDHWELPIIIKQGEFVNEIGGVGMAIDAHEGKDIYDDYNPPALGNGAEIQISSLASNTLAKSIVGLQGEYTWEFTTEAAGNEIIELEWENRNLEGNTKEFFLYHINSHQLIDMKVNNGYNFSPNELNQFKLFFGDNLRDKIKPEESRFSVAFPNPASSSISFPFNVGKEDGKAHISLILFNSKGRQVQEILSKEFEPGFYSHNWIIERENLSAGIYFCRLIMQNANGNIITNAQKIIIR